MNGLLDPVQHAYIIANMEKVAMVAGVQGRFLYESMTHYCGEEEVNWVHNFHKYRAQGLPGLLLEGLENPDIRCQAIAGAFIRNYIDARCIPLNTLLDDQENGGAATPTVLLIPNLFVSSFGKNVSTWKMQAIYDILLQRAVRNKPTVCWIEDSSKLEKCYGKPFADFLKQYKLVTNKSAVVS